jgi:PIN domain nuclease of toxin-antitoxin system
VAGSLDWPHRDPFDRLLAATALINGWPLISADPAFDRLTGLRRVW